MKCEECMMYDPYDNYCRWFQQVIPDITYECTIEPDENYKGMIKDGRNTTRNNIG